MGELLNGRRVAKKVEAEVRERVAGLEATPGLAVVLVGDDPASSTYVRLKRKACKRVGIRSTEYHLYGDVEQDALLRLVDTLNADDHIHGILVQMPLPRHVHDNVVIQRIDPAKDVDGYHSANLGHLVTSRTGTGLSPCTPRGVMRLLREYDVPLRGAHCVVIGRSRVVGRPMAHMLLAADATVTMCHRHTPDSARLASLADVVVVAVGQANMVGGDWIKPGAVVVDVGFNRDKDGRICGDVNFDEAIARASLLSPVPGGAGPMTIAMLLDNTATACERLTRQERPI